MPKLTLAVLALLLGCVSVFSQQATGTLRQIIPGHYVYGASTYNSGIIVTSEGVVVLDALNSEAVARAQREAIASTIRQPLRILVSSTFHNNYSKGNVAYADVLKIGHENYRTDLLELMQREHVSAEEQKARLPNQTFRDRMTLYLGGKEIQILYVGRAHTRGDSIVFVPQDRIVYLSELHFADQFLFINDGYGLDWLRRAGCGRSAWSRHFRAGTWTDSGRPSRNPTRAPPLPADVGGCARRRSERDRARSNGGSGGCCHPMAPV